MIIDEQICAEIVQCYHCGETCDLTIIQSDDKAFCCHGCQTVYEILSGNDLCSYYELDAKPGLRQKSINESKFDYLQNQIIAEKLLDFWSPQLNKVTFYIPTIHCSSCIYLLEHLNRINPGVIGSKINFTDKELHLDYNPERIDLKALVQLLAQLGYQPDINLNSTTKKNSNKSNLAYLKLGVAGFCFGNIMLLSFPDYFGFEVESDFRLYFTYISLLLSLPVLLFSSSEYFFSAYVGLQKKHVSIDVPIALGILTLFLRSTFEVITQSGTGYFDSLTGLIFFLLIGKWFQNKTYQNLTFNRDYLSYFPLSTTRIVKSENETIMVNDLMIGDKILVRNEEIIPADAIQVSPEACIDYSFVTGESVPVHSRQEDKIFAGGRIKGMAAVFQVTKQVSQTYLTSLWNNEIYDKNKSSKSNQLIDKISMHFTLVVLSFAFLSGAYWMFVDASKAMFVFTAVLIVACPCALALATPFTLGSVLNELGKQKFYLKSTQVIESLWRISHIVFDKTGTITTNHSGKVSFEGRPLASHEILGLKVLVQNSTHPVSMAINSYLTHTLVEQNELDTPLNYFNELLGKGLEGKLGKHTFKLGTASFVNATSFALDEPNGTKSYLSIDDEIVGVFVIKNNYREHLSQLIGQLKNKFSLSILSGDNEKEKARLSHIFPDQANIHFNQKPEDKFEQIKKLKAGGDAVMMIGDGLNDAGALKISDFGVAITDDISAFTPASYAILHGSQLQHLAQMLHFVSQSKIILKAAFVLSILYNIIGLCFATTGHLTPIFAAILMPLSSITVVLFSTLSVKFVAKLHFNDSKTSQPLTNN